MRRGTLLALAATAGLASAAGAGLTTTTRGGAGSLRDALRHARFQLRSVDFVGLEALRARELWELARVQVGTPLVDVDPALVQERLSGHPRVARCAALRVPPDRLVIGVEERVPIAVDPSSGAGIDADGARFALRPGEGEALPRARGVTSLLLPLLLGARELGIELTAVEAPRPGDLRFRTRGSALLVRLRREPRRALLDWRRLRASGLLEEYGARELDLRFAGNAILRGPGTQTRGVRDGSS